MKKEVRAQIEALAGQILQQKDAMNTTQLKGKVSRLLEQLTVLEYLEKQIENTDEIPIDPAKDSKSYREENWFVEPEPIPQPEHKDALVEPLMEKIKDLVAQMPQESQQVDELLEEILPKKKLMKNDLEEFAASYQETPTFERKVATPKTVESKEPVSNDSPISDHVPHKVPAVAPKSIQPETTIEVKKTKSVNDMASKGLSVGLNDRIAFIKHLFNDSAEEYTRVLSQLSTFTSFEDAHHFIKIKVKPDYNYWLGKEEFGDRFVNIVEKSFN